jgi:hypothetical protein
LLIEILKLKNMKKVFVVLFSFVVIMACNKSDDNKNPDLIGKWKLIEVLADPGDGSGTFQRVTSEKIMEFHTDGNVTSNGSICDMSIESDTPRSGTYSLSDSTINSPDCQNLPLKIRFRKEGSVLIIYYPCYEACMTKYTKLEIP